MRWFLFILLAGCADHPVKFPTGSLNVNCELVQEDIVLRNQKVTLPASGKFVLESHLVTKADEFLGYPKTITESIEDHLARSCYILRAIAPGTSASCGEVYATKYHRQWTPSESGEIGQGSVGSLKPTVLEEMFSGNMYWTSRPYPGTKFLACTNQCVVVAVGYETGPRSKKYLGGFQGEVHWFLGANSNSSVYWGRLKDQTINLGPVTCR